MEVVDPLAIVVMEVVEIIPEEVVIAGVGVKTSGAATSKLSTTPTLAATCMVLFLVTGAKLSSGTIPL